MKWYPSILEVEKADELKALFKVFIFHFEFRFRHTIKRDASLSGLRKIECSSIKIKSKERHSSTSRAYRIFFGDFWCQKSRHLVTSLCGECGHQKSRRESELPTVRSPDSGQVSRCLDPWLACWPPSSKVPTYVRSPDHRKSRRTPGVTTLTWSSWLWPCCEHYFL